MREFVREQEQKVEMTETTVHEVIQRLQAQNCEALLELLEFDQALDAFFRSMGVLAVAARSLHSTTQTLPVASAGQIPERTRAVQEQAEQLSLKTAQLLGALRELRAGVAGWHIPGGTHSAFGR